MRELLNKTGVHPKRIGAVITNCSLFNPTPSLSATIMHHFGMGASTINYNLGGMGCSGGAFGGWVWLFFGVGRVWLGGGHGQLQPGG